MKNMNNNAVAVNFDFANITEEQLRQLAKAMGFALVKNTDKRARTLLIKTLANNGIAYDPEKKFPACKTGYVNTNVFEFLLNEKANGNSAKVTNTIKVLATAEMHKEGRGLKMSIVKTVYNMVKPYQMPEKAINKTAKLIQTHTSDATGWVDNYHELISFREAKAQADRFRNRKVADSVVEANTTEIVKAQ
jgi:hypothetical protein